ncbi:PREDICTED: uncharacterized protein LOC109584545 isoform X2 [Amphimedon queenslandica]|uniref:Ig-like domain-containing protein n=1 Tax=Amphimedon queenslandica TaxID=400682 RepID=A0AAN0JFZ2_AMPQE|nr:PREDICTED: uncharacterized protein LOC109584545 isoform X2 [Amphimedon queenslandica]|eukprot:XP_019855879.1 PREDICTED: uncharacterized protein LOC109584545 isoform X2 [Amphimedon queenslandica]
MLQVLFLMVSLACSVKAILAPPLPINASLGSTAVFTCVCHDCIGQYWLVNGRSAEFQDIQEKGVFPNGPYIFPNGSKQYNVSVPATVQWNESTIQCVVNRNWEYFESPIVKLLVQGLLSKVTATVTQINSTTLLLKYEAPDTLTGVPILYYNIVISPTDVSVNITDTQYKLYLNEFCSTYNISITPWNIVGKGNTTMVSGIILYQVPVITTPHLVEGTLEAFIDFQYNKYCIGTVPQLVLLHINNEKYNCSLVSPTTICTSIITADINDANVTINISKVLEYGTTYSVEMSLYTINNIGSNNFTFKFNTYHVISATILSSNDSTVCVQCNFRNNSQSTGCYAAFQLINNNEGPISATIVYYEIIKPLMDTVAIGCINTLPNGMYSVSILDTLSYQEGRFNNTAINMSSIIIINNTIITDAGITSSAIFISTTIYDIESYVVNIASPDVINSIPYSSSYVTFSSYDISSSYATCSSDYVTPSSYATSSGYVTSLRYANSSNYDDFVPVATNNAPVLIISLASILPVLIIIIIMVLLLGVCLIVKKKGLSEDAAIQSNEAYGISLPGKASGMMQSNIAYESISMALQTNAIYEQVDIIVYEKTK